MTTQFTRDIKLGVGSTSPEGRGAESDEADVLRGPDGELLLRVLPTSVPGGVIEEVKPGSGGSGKRNVINLYSNTSLGPVGTKIVRLVAHYPKIGGLYITSGYRDGNDHHGGLSYRGSPTAAVDFGAYDKVGREEGQRRMRDFARWVEDEVPGYKRIVELIHTTPYRSDDGFYVKNGQKVGPGWYGAATEAAHLNHVHLAMSEKQVTAALDKVTTTMATAPE